jgi:sodium-dependent phosphate cotransporter
MRRVPIDAAKGLGKATRIWKGFPIVYIGVAFFLLPITALAVSTCFTQDSTAFVALGIILCTFILLAVLYTIYWCRCKDGKNKCYMCFVRRENKRVMMQELPNTLEHIHKDLGRLKEAVGLPDEIEEEDEEVQALITSDKMLDEKENEGIVAARDETSDYDENISMEMET